MSDRNSNKLNRDESIAEMQAELLEAILSEEAIFPWNPADPETENYLSNIEGVFNLTDWSESEDIVPRSQDLFAQLALCWEKFPPRSLDSSLQEKFGDRVPTDWLEAISARVQELTEAGLSPIDRLVECVKPLLSDWAIEDLQVFARPFAYAMRGKGFEESEVKQWEELSEVERARYALKVAHYALERTDRDLA
ncbi:MULTISPECIES: hypothetical protein [Spirulina sp. CCY15215]|uniref:hypothetical protein n=1 Tax=Spirulina sp. CCY15215 TaxID=2767591 RepID=UPI00194F37F9|nr:hypothetical protein [Spirulina major]